MKCTEMNCPRRVVAYTILLALFGSSWASAASERYLIDLGRASNTTVFDPATGYHWNDAIFSLNQTAVLDFEDDDPMNGVLVSNLVSTDNVASTIDFSLKQYFTQGELTVRQDEPDGPVTYWNQPTFASCEIGVNCESNSTAAGSDFLGDASALEYPLSATSDNIFVVGYPGDPNPFFRGYAIFSLTGLKTDGTTYDLRMFAGTLTARSPMWSVAGSGEPKQALVAQNNTTETAFFDFVPPDVNGEITILFQKNDVGGAPGTNMWGVLDIVSHDPVLQNADFDGDGDVDGRDFLIWQRGFGTGDSLETGDADGSGTVDGEDLAIWQNQYGSDTPELLGVTVPEPASVTCIAMSLMTWLGVRRRITS